MSGIRRELARAIVGGLAILGLATSLGVATTTPAYADAGSSIMGTVTLPAGSPAEWMDSVSVSVSPFSGLGGGSGGIASVDRDTGQYEITGLAAGSYRVFFSTFGSGPAQKSLVSEYFDDTTDFSSAVAVVTSPESPAMGVNATLEAATTISGTVTLPTGVPAEWTDAVRVSATPVGGTTSSMSVTVDRNTGHYEIGGLPPGAYRVYFSVYRFGSPGQSSPNLIAEYFDSAGDQASAMPVETSLATPATGIDAILEAGATISGTVSLPDGAPPEWMDAVSVSASLMTGTGAGLGGYTTIDRGTGQYVLSGLAPGTYRIYFSVSGSLVDGQMVTNLVPEYFDDTRDYASAKGVTTSSASPATGIDAALEASSKITGRVRDTGGSPVESIGVFAVDAVTGGIPFAWGRTDASGVYTLSQLPAGQYKVFVGETGVSSPYRRTFVGGTTFESAATIGAAPGAAVSVADATVGPVNANAAPPLKPTLTAGQSDDSVVEVTWPTVSAADPVLAYNVSFASGLAGGGDPQSVGPTNSTEVSTEWGSAVVLVSALTASTEGEAGVIILNDPAAPAAPEIRVTRESSSVTVSAGSSVPEGAEWWFAALRGGAGALELEHLNVEGDSSTFTDIDPNSSLQVFGGWRTGETWSQVATLTSKPGGPVIPSVHPWFAGKYAELGGSSGSLGAPVKSMMCQSSSCWQEFAGGVLTSDGRQIVKLSTAYVTTWLANGGPDGALGIVAGPESCFGTYCATPFSHGVIKWTPGVGVSAIPVHAWFEAKWKEFGGLTGSLGSPARAMQCQASSCWQEFSGGVLTSDGREIVKLSRAYVSTWLAWGGPDGDLGLVVGGESCYGSYCQTPFAGGVVVWVPDRGVFPVAKAWFYDAWIARGGANGSLGLPVDAMRCQTSACYQNFQNATLTSSTSGIEALSSAYVESWLAGGGPGGSLGLLTGPEKCFGSYCQVPFQQGLMVWEPGQGVRALTGTALDQWNAEHAAPAAPPTQPANPGQPGNPGDSKNCSDFASQAQAQTWFDQYFPIYGDVAKLDGDNNRLACESLR
ncbi:MAG: carboxypeptidase regulatory-like domain-containing protein [Microbacterium sp.]|uniref:carboxypeptidase regulatory-like domain-containing protein n=1 Tax=Microbacterium sp. TaxID=51671 RepID=UPI00272858A2|nr:carboxypeptidase regulatory-like domain-containing protein [Microbacterium sp.]MDO8384335.1 carboxypeptidase regulatory-like domain-containing protein [Microbacterium sp.]